MLFSDRPRAHYQNAPVHEVICQLRFPTILSINTTEPADFQEMIRGEFPQYVRRQSPMPPKVVAGRLEQQSPVTNYHFLSEDGRWKLNLTKDFISLSTLHYTDWETFARQLDKPLAAFIRTYQPAYFQRVGLRYINVFSRAKLGLEGFLWRELFASAYLGAMNEPDVTEEAVLTCSSDYLLKLDSSCQAKIHAGPGRVKPNVPGATPDPEVKFLLDLDLFMTGNTPCTLSAAALETLHGHSTRVFEGTLTDTLRQAMLPE